jgi:hypothetical protein
MERSVAIRRGKLIDGPDGRSLEVALGAGQRSLSRR